MDSGRFANVDILLLAGLYGSGKTEFARKYFADKGRSRISRSEIRKLLYEMTTFGEKWDAKHFSEQDDILVKHIERKIIEHFTHNKRKIILINTFVTKKSRRAHIENAKKSNKTIGIVFLNTPLRVCLDQNEQYSKGVPATVINTLFPRIELPEKSEGFNDIEIIEDFRI
jgi:tRNA uridine 5-carbamoylmethylation protein Kti12